MNIEVEGRTASQIVQQTNELALLLMRRIYSREPAGAEAPNLHDSKDPRGQHCWSVACEVQQLLTSTDPEDALSELEDSPAAETPPAEGEFVRWVARERYRGQWRDWHLVLDHPDAVANAKAQAACTPEEYQVKRMVGD